MRFILCFAVVLCALMPVPAGALDGGSVLLGFGYSYTTASGESRVHRGADLAMASGAPVTAPAGGTVAFAGRVPGADGGTVLAVSIDTAQGRVTLLPLAALDVRRGATVDAGDRIGTLAGTGDASSSAPHVHVSLRSGDLYLDPESLFAVVAPVPAPEPTPESAPVPVAAPVAGAATGSARAATARTPAIEIGAAGEPVAVPAPSPATVPAPVPVPVEGVSAALQPGVELAPLSTSAPVPAVAGPDAFGLAMRLGKGLAANPIGLASVVSAVLILGFVLTRRSLERKMCSHPSVSDRLGKIVAAAAGR